MSSTRKKMILWLKSETRKKRHQHS